MRTEFFYKESDTSNPLLVSIATRQDIKVSSNSSCMKVFVALLMENAACLFTADLIRTEDLKWVAINSNAIDCKGVDPSINLERNSDLKHLAFREGALEIRQLVSTAAGRYLRSRVEETEVITPLLMELSQKAF